MSAPDKRALRLAVRARLAALAPETQVTASGAIADRLAAMADWRAAETVFLYASMPGEPDTDALIQALLAEGRRVCLPLIRRNGVMSAGRLRDPARVSIGPFGIRMPAGDDIVPPQEIDLALVPGLAFDPRGARLGRGGGYYDRFLPTAARAARIGICFDSQILPTIPCESFDQRVDVVVTEARALQTGRTGFKGIF